MKNLETKDRNVIANL
jgi:uncharacterized coiled-coil protein SlyX